MVSGPERIRSVGGSVDLLPAPGRVVDAVDVILGLENDAAVLGNGAREVLVVEDALRLLERQNAAGTVAAVHLEGGLIGVHVDPDTGPLRGDGEDRAVGAPVVAA